FFGDFIVKTEPATKIVELSKNNQQLQAAFEQEKIKSKRHSDRVRELEREVPKQTPARTQLRILRLDTHTGKSLKDKLVAANLKVAEYRNQIQSCKQELKVAHKVRRYLCDCSRGTTHCRVPHYVLGFNTHAFNYGCCRFWQVSSEKTLTFISC
uniref:Uncharacterized protein n=1 Tax=Gouania willdenowi TaxID=441366 RepID=A0A8C5EJK4_GOUWI